MNREQVFSEGFQKGTKETEAFYGKSGLAQKLGKGIGIAVFCLLFLLAIKVGWSGEKEEDITSQTSAQHHLGTDPNKLWSTMLVVGPGESSERVDGVGGTKLCLGYPSAPVQILVNEDRIVDYYPPGHPKYDGHIDLGTMYTVRILGKNERATVEAFRSRKHCSSFNSTRRTSSE